VKPARITADRLVAAALVMIDREGLENLSMRRLGAALGIQGMAIYYYFASKELLLDAVAERLLDDWRLADDAAGDWVDWLRRAAHAYRALAKRHPRAFPLLAMRRFATPGGFRRLEVFCRVMREAGFDAQMSARVFRAIGYFANGAALADIASTGPAALDDFRDAASYPNVARVAPFLRPSQLDDIFDFGLEMLLSSLRATPKSVPVSKPRRKSR
jgi:AcrR family transcriptional regulator